MGRPRKTSEDYIADFKSVHGNNYDYTNTVCSGWDTKIQVFCNTHQQVFATTPSTHKAGSGCRLCANKSMSNSLSKDTEYFVNKSRQIHGDKYDYSLSVYKNNKTYIIIVCPTHGAFQQRAYSHLRGGGCKECYFESKRKSLTSFVDESNIVHGFEYDYSEVEYISLTRKVDIKCSVHGIFRQQAGSHLKGHGCPKCSFEKSSLNSSGGLSPTSLPEDADKIPAILYHVRITNHKKNDVFDKIGVTTKDVGARFKTLKKGVYTYEVITEYKDSLEKVVNIEYEILKHLKEEGMLYYAPCWRKARVAGWTETFKPNFENSEESIVNTTISDLEPTL